MNAASKNAYRPRNPQWFNRLLKMSYGLYLRKRHRVRTEGAELFAEIKPPYVVVPNHMSLRDAMLSGSVIPAPVYWIASDSNLRGSALRMVLNWVGTIPKSKFIPDIETIHAIVHVIRKSGGVVGIFPEGTASFDGRTQDLVPGFGKLLKLLKVPVVVVRIKGAYSAMPRWSWREKRGQVSVEYVLAASAAEAASLGAEELQGRVERALAYDEGKWLAASGLTVGSAGRAEHLETVIFGCPSCGDCASMRSSSDRFFCVSCGASYRLDRHFLLREEGGRGEVLTLAEASDRQRTALDRLLNDVKDGPLFSDVKVHVLRGRKLSPLYRYGRATAALYRDRVELTMRDGSLRTFPLQEVDGAGVFKRNLFEFYHNRLLYQFRFPTRHSSAYKWLLALRILSERS